MQSQTGWDGRYCENNQDGCSVLECFEGLQCYDVPAPESGVICEACPDGYKGDGEKCTGMYTFVFMHTHKHKILPTMHKLLLYYNTQMWMSAKAAPFVSRFVSILLEALPVDVKQATDSLATQTVMVHEHQTSASYDVCTCNIFLLFLPFRC